MDRNDVTGRVHLIFKTHLDMGFTDLATNVVDRYFSEFIPGALSTAAAMRNSGTDDRFIWTTGAWLIYEYLERAPAPDRRLMEAAIAAGDITWHAMPFTMHCELCDPPLFRFGLGLSRALDERFGRTTIAAKMTDVPGHTRGIVPLLAGAGVEFLHIGVNEASTVPDVPPVFVWRDTSGAEIVVMYHNSYGATMSVPGVPDCISFAHTMDNRGPQDSAAVRDTYSQLRHEYPNATVEASTLDRFAAALRPVRDTLPVITSEIGDTWIHGVASDPRKVAQYRALLRLRSEWVETGKVAVDNPQFVGFSRQMLLVPEHTWGLDDKTFLADYENYTQDRFQEVRESERFIRMEESWDEQRAYLRNAVGALGDSSLAAAAARILAATAPRRPDVSLLSPVDVGELRVATQDFELGFDAESGAINLLKDIRSGTVISDHKHPLGTFGFQVFSHVDYDRFVGQYIRGKHEWAPPDFSKPGLEKVSIERGWFPFRVDQAWSGQTGGGLSVVLRLQPEARVPEVLGGPAEAYVSVTLPGATRTIDFDVQWFGKPKSRLPQACWFSFVPLAAAADAWTMRKLGTVITPSDVVRNGNHRLHAVDDLLLRSGGPVSLGIETLDAPLVALGEPSLLRFSNDKPDMKGGVHFNLYNNVWGTNFPSWYGDDSRFRFVFSAKS